ncbi:MAG: radical SAM protein [Clostridiales bacterium]|nr:radical SAM protein [Clostridiales bacterium]
MFFCPTLVCNLSCKYCVQSYWKHSENYKSYIQRWGGAYMTLETVEKAIFDCQSFPDKIKDINLTSFGEPLLHTDLPRIVRLINEAGIADRIQFFTNGTLLTKKLSEELLDAGLSELRISLQGITAEKYKDIAGATVDLTQIIERIAYFCSIKGNAKLYIKCADIALDGNEQKFYEMFGDICDKIYVEHIVPLFKDVDYSYLEDKDGSKNKYQQDLKTTRVCPNCFYTIAVWPGGDVLPCCNFYEPPIGNVHTQSLVDIWNGKARKEVLLRQLRCEYDYNCVDCYVPNNQQPSDNLDGSVGEIIKRLEVI